jgi:hypothetical protein
MIRYTNTLKGFAIQTTNGELGHVDDFFFDDERWTVRYLVISTGPLFLGRRLLISPAAVAQVRRDDREVRLNLSSEQVRGSPDVDTHRPVSRQREVEMNAYYGWPDYWLGSGLWYNGMTPAAMLPVGRTRAQSAAARARRVGRSAVDRHLRSVNEVRGYHIRAEDGDLGHVEDFGVQDETWALRYVIIDTRNWLPGKCVILSTAWVKRVDWGLRKLEIGLRMQQIRDAPEPPQGGAMDREFEIALHRHYQRQQYWLQSEKRSRSKS